MSKPYTTSIPSNYGDVENVKKDCKIINEILSRQGTQLLIDIIAEQVGNTAIKFKFTLSDRAMTRIALVDALDDALKERL